MSPSLTQDSGLRCTVCVRVCMGWGVGPRPHLYMCVFVCFVEVHRFLTRIHQHRSMTIIDIWAWCIATQTPLCAIWTAVMHTHTLLCVYSHACPHIPRRQQAIYFFTFAYFAHKGVELKLCGKKHSTQELSKTHKLPHILYNNSEFIGSQRSERKETKGVFEEEIAIKAGGCQRERKRCQRLWDERRDDRDEGEMASRKL